MTDSDAFFQLDALTAVAREHGGVPAFRVLPGQDTLAGSIVLLTVEEERGNMLLVDVLMLDRDREDLRLVIPRELFELMLGEVGLSR